MRRREKPSSFRSGPRRTARKPSGNACANELRRSSTRAAAAVGAPASAPKSQVAGKRLYHPVKCAAGEKLGALARGMAQGHNSMETMSTPRQDMLVGALEGFLEDLPPSS